MNLHHYRKPLTTLTAFMPAPITMTNGRARMKNIVMATTSNLPCHTFLKTDSIECSLARGIKNGLKSLAVRHTLLGVHNVTREVRGLVRRAHINRSVAATSWVGARAHQ